MLNSPNETQFHILSYLSTKDIKNVRLVCRDLASKGARFLATTLYISPRKRDMEIFGAITGHQEIRRSVVDIVYDTSQFYDFSIREYVLNLYRQFVCLATWFPEAHKSASDLEHLLADVVDSREFHHLAQETSLRIYPHGHSIPVLEGFQQYSRMVQEEATIYNGSWVNTICKGLQLLGPVRSVTTIGQWIRTRAINKADKGSLFTEASAFCTYASPFARTWPLSTLIPGIESIGNRSGSRFREVVDFLRSVKKQPRVFNLRAYQEADVRNLFVRTVHLLDTIEHLTVLELDLTMPEEWLIARPVMPNLTLLTRTLERASSLHELTLVMPSFVDNEGVEPEYLFPYTSSHVFPSAAVWRSPTLRCLRLSSLTFSFEDLIGLLFVSLPKLTSLHLHGIDLTDGYWSDIVQGLQYVDGLESCLFAGAIRSPGSCFALGTTDVRQHDGSGFLLIDDYSDDAIADGWMERLNAAFSTHRAPYINYLGKPWTVEKSSVID